MKSVEEIKFLMDRIESPRLTDTQYRDKKKSLVESKQFLKENVGEGVELGIYLKIGDKILKFPSNVNMETAKDYLDAANAFLEQPNADVEKTLDRIIRAAKTQGIELTSM